jgi:hypothetical protein
VAVRIEPSRDDRLKKILDNPSEYFVEERQRIRDEVDAEVARGPQSSSLFFPLPDYVADRSFRLSGEVWCTTDA